MMTEVKAKVCRGCRKELSVSEYYFDQRREAPMARCKACSKKRAVATRRVHPIYGNEAMKQWRKDNPKKWAKIRAKSYAKHRDKILAREKTRYAFNVNGRREKTWESNLKRKYGISIAQYYALLAAQNNGCAICGGINKTKRLGVDHNHITNKTRGLLCTDCNCMIGYSREIPERLLRAIDYLRKYAQ